MKYSNDFDKVSYSLGLSIASNLISSGVKTLNAEAFNDGLATVFEGRMPEINPDEANKILQNFFEGLQKEQGNAAKEAGNKFLEENKKQEGVITLPSGLQYKILKNGNGPKPKASDTVKCYFRFFHSERGTGRIPGKRGNCGMGRSLTADEYRFEMATVYSFGISLWQPWCRPEYRTE